MKKSEIRVYSLLFLFPEPGICIVGQHQATALIDMAEQEPVASAGISDPTSSFGEA
jgi:hypothetical protein